MNNLRAVKIFERREVIIRGGRFVYTDGKQGPDYVAKEQFIPYTRDLRHLAHEIAINFRDCNVEVVVGPAVAGALVSTFVAHELTGLMTGPEVIGLWTDDDCGDLVLKRGFAKRVKGKRVLIVEDTMNTGATTRKIIKAVRKAGGIVVGVGCICNRSASIVTADSLGASILHSLINLDLEMYEPDALPDWLADRPINTEFGHGKAFLAAQNKS